VHDDPTDPLEQAGAAFDDRGSRKLERSSARAEARARRTDQKRVARQRKLEAKQRKREAREQEREAREEEREARDAERDGWAEEPEERVVDEEHEARDEEREQQEEEERQRAWELSAPADALVARLPTIKPLYAAIITGVLSGTAVVLLAIGASAGCEAVRGTSSCGGGIGLLATVALLAIEVLIGANLLKAWQIADPFSTSFLGVGVVAIFAMLLFLDDIDSPWMLLVIPLMTAAAFAVSWWVTVRFVDEHPMASEVDSERGEPDFVQEPADEDEDSNR
jgi:hypothetical protein